MGSRKAAVLLVAGVMCFVAALVARGEPRVWRTILLQALQPAGMICVIFASYHSGAALLAQWRRGEPLFSGSSRAAKMTLVGVFLTGVVLTLLVVIFSEFPLSR